MIYPILKHIDIIFSSKMSNPQFNEAFQKLLSASLIFLHMFEKE